MEEEEESIATIQSKSSKQDTRADAPDLGTYWTGPNDYLLAQATRVNFVTAKRIPFKPNSDTLAVQLQRFVHHEGTRPPNRKILMHLRLLTFYPPVEDIIPELITLLESENVHVCRLAHYHLRAAAHLLGSGEHQRDVFETLEREIIRPSPARRAAATKTLAKVVRVLDVPRSVEFVTNVFNTIGGARVEDPNKAVQRRIVGVGIPGTDLSKKVPKTKKFAGVHALLTAQKVVDATTTEEAQNRDKHKSRDGEDDGAGGTIGTFAEAAVDVKSKRGKVLVGHAVFAALRRINRVSNTAAKIEAFFFDSGFLSVNPSTVRHCMALMEIRSYVSPAPVSRYLSQRLPHKNPPVNKKLKLQDLGSKVYFARLLGALAEDPDLDAYIPDDGGAAKKGLQEGRTGGQELKEALGETTLKKKATGLFKFLFNKDRVDEIKGAVISTKNVVTTAVAPKMKRRDAVGVEFAEALVNLLKNASNRVLIEALRGLAHRKWTTWFEAPLPQSALYNSPELAEASPIDDFGDDDDDEDNFDDDDEDELGAYENDMAASEREASNAPTPKRKSDAGNGVNYTGEEEAENATWFSRLRSDRKEKREARIESDAPFYLRKLGHGVVPALEVVLRRIYAAMLHDEPIRRFAAANATVALARAKIYGHVNEDHRKFRIAQSNYRGYAAGGAPSSARDVALVQEGGALTTGGSSGPGRILGEEEHPFEALVKPLTEVMAEDPNQYVRSRAAIALAFVLGAGAGRKRLNRSSSNVDDEYTDRTANASPDNIMVRYFGGYLQNPHAGRGVGLRLVSEFVDYVVDEVLDASPELAPSAVQLVELWAATHSTVGVCGRLGAIWEKVLSMGMGTVVGASIFRAIESAPERERVASAAAVFLRRRTLDLAVLTVGASHLLGPSAECRVFAVEALGGAAALAGDPFRICVYERLVELVRVRGLGLKGASESVLACLDMLYSARERFSEARALNQVPRDGSCTAQKWLVIVWKLAAEASSGAQILLGAPPPPGWQPLGPGGAADVANAENLLGPVRDRRKQAKSNRQLESAASVDIERLRITEHEEEKGRRRKHYREYHEDSSSGSLDR